MMLGIYDIKDKISSDGQRIVYRAVNTKNRESVLIKVFQEQVRYAGDSFMLQNELEIMSDPNNTECVKAIEIETLEGYPALIMEDDGSVTLKELQRGGYLSLIQKLKIAYRAAEALSSLHNKGIVHKNISSAAIWVNPESGVVKLSEMGISDYKGKLKAIALSGSGRPEYASPEQSGRMTRPVDYRTDIYSLGITFYEFFCGQLPFQAGDINGLIFAHMTKLPTFPCELNSELPGQMGAIIMMMMEKEPEDRYQSFRGVMGDINWVIQFVDNPQSEPFELGKQDIPLKYVPSLKPYGKVQLIDAISDEKDKVNRGKNRFVLVAGDRGTGKTYLLGQLYSSWINEDGLIIVADFSAVHEMTPYSAIRLIFDAFAEYITKGPKAQATAFTHRIMQIPENGVRELGGIFPSLSKFFPGEIAPSHLPAAETQPFIERLIVQLGRIIIDFEPTLSILADCVDRADRESLRIVEALLKQRHSRGFIFVGSAASNQQEIPGIREIFLGKDNFYAAEQMNVYDYTQEDIQSVLKDSFGITKKKSIQLGKLIFRKTGGNPRNVMEFIGNSCEEGWIYYNFEFGEWDYKLSELERSQVMENVAVRALRRLRLLADRELTLLKTAAVLGYEFSLKDLSRITGIDGDRIRDDLSIPMGYGLVEGRYQSANEGNQQLVFRFSHDSVYERLKGMMEQSEQMAISLSYGRILIDENKGTVEELEIFLTHMNYALPIISDDGERRYLAQKNLEYSQRLKRIGVLERALNYVEKGLGILENKRFDENDDLSFKLTLERAELAYLNRQFGEAEAFFDALIANLNDPVNRAKAIRIKMTVFINQGRMAETIALAEEALTGLGIAFESEPSEIAVGRELLNLNLAILRKTPKDLENTPVSTDPRIHLITDIYMTLVSVSYLVHKNLFIYVCLRILNITLKNGLTSNSPYAFSIYGLIVGNAMGDTKKGIDYGDLGIRLAERFGNRNILGKCEFTYGFFLNHWINHPSGNLPHLEKAMDLSEQTGDLVFYAYSAAAYILSMIDAGTPLNEVLKSIDLLYDKVKDMQVEDIFNLMILMRQMVSALNGATDDACSLNALDFDEALFVKKLKGSSMQSIYAVYLVQKLKLYYIYGRYQQADGICQELHKYAKELMGLSVYPEYYQYYSLNLLELGPLSQRQRRALSHNQRKLRGWARNAPGNFKHRYLVVEGVHYQKKGKLDKAGLNLTEALSIAQQEGFLSEEALINELLGRFYNNGQQAAIRRMYYKSAFHLYNQWGAPLKAAHIRSSHRDIIFDADSSEAAASGGFGEGQLKQADLLSVFKSAQTLSSEVRSEDLLKKLIEIISENAGANKTVILMKKDDIVPVAWSTGDGIEIVGKTVNSGCEYSETVVNQGARSMEPIIYDDVSTSPFLRKDPYIIKYAPISVMCLPIIWQGALMGILYMENNRIAGAFNPKRQEVMQVLTAQFVISYDNALLYENLMRSEADLKNHKYELERIVDERTTELSRANYEIQMLLDHAGQGFFSFDKSERIGTELSRECYRLFQKNIAGEKFSDVFRDYCSVDESPLLSRIADKAFNCPEVFQARVYLSLLPQKIQIVDKIVSVEYQMMENFDNRRIMTILTDVTETQAMMESREEEKRVLKTIVKIVGNRNSFLRSLDDYLQFAEGIHERFAAGQDTPTKILGELYRMVHTFKGDFAQWGLRFSETALHEIESLISYKINSPGACDEVEEFIEELDFHKAIERDMQMLEAVFGKGLLQQDEHYEISRAEVLRMENLLMNQDYPALIDHIKDIRRVNFKELLMPYDDYIASIAFGMDKKINPLSITGDDVRVDRKHYHKLVKSFIHIFRNDMDYGIESPEERLRNNKPESGTISCRIATLKDSKMVVEIADDGRGIDHLELLEILRTKGSGNVLEMNANNRHEVLQTIFSDGISTGSDVSMISGRGIGLSAVRAEVEKLGGTIVVDSIEGEGTVFVMSLPLIH